MWCEICKHELGECLCPDIEERLLTVAKSGGLIYRMCNTCKKHYALCKCGEPEWITSDQYIGSLH